MLIKSLAPPSSHIQQQAQNNPHLMSVNLLQLVLVVSKFWRFRDLRTRVESSNLMYKYALDPKVALRSKEQKR